MSAQKRRSETSRALRAATRGDKYGVSLELELAQLHASTGDSKRRICVRWGNRRHSAPDRNARCRINAGKSAGCFRWLGLSSKPDIATVQRMQPSLASCRCQHRAKSPIFMRRLRRCRTTLHGSRKSLSWKAQPAAKPSEYGASSTNSMRRYVLAIIFFANCGRFFRRNIRSL
jgi:hypothetical protein